MEQAIAWIQSFLGTGLRTEGVWAQPAFLLEKIQLEPSRDGENMRRHGGEPIPL
jgi:hypothetical protein